MKRSFEPTFDKGKFNVTPISYEHLISRTCRNVHHPTLIDLVRIYELKTEKMYFIFVSTLKILEPELSTVMAFVKDDEEALENAFIHNLNSTTHLLGRARNPSMIKHCNRSSNE